MFNHFSGLGFVGADARVNEARTRAVFQIAISPPRRKPEATEEARPYWIPCVVFGERVDFAERYVRKGAQVLVSGSLATFQFLPDDSDTPIDRFEVRVQQIELIRAPGRGGRSRGTVDPGADGLE